MVYFPHHAWKTILEYTLADDNQIRVLLTYYLVRKFEKENKEEGCTVKECLDQSLKTLRTFVQYVSNRLIKEDQSYIRYFLKNMICLLHCRIVNCFLILWYERIESQNQETLIGNLDYKDVRDIFRCFCIETVDDVLEEHEEHEYLFLNDFITIQQYDAFLIKQGIGSKKRCLLMKKIYMNGYKNFVQLNMSEYVIESLVKTFKRPSILSA